MDFLSFRAFLQFAFLVLLSVSLTKSEVFSAVDKMKALFSLETEIFKEIHTFRLKESESGRDLDSGWVRTLESLEIQNRADQTKANLVENPIDLYQLLRRMTSGVQGLVDHIVCEDCEEWMTVNAQDIKKLRNNANTSGLWPTERDVKGAAISLVRLAEVYALNLTDVLDGRLKDSQTEPLTDDDVYYIVAEASELGLSYQCIRWLKAGLGRALNRPDKLNAVRFYKRLANIYYQERMPWVSLELIEEAVKTFPEEKSLSRELDFYRPHAESAAGSRGGNTVKRKYMTKLIKDYERLCRGRKAPYRDGLCQYKQTRIPIYRVKEEVLSRDPRIAMFHDVIYENEMRHIKRSALELLFRSIVVTKDAPTSDGRISQSAWLWDKKDPLIAKITRRVELFTGLSLEERKPVASSEALQVLNYGIGGMYEPHYDFFNISYKRMDDINPELVDAGDRLATWLFYLNDVKLGGATVFPSVNVRVPVIKGAAAFWYNLKRDSRGDDRTLHAGCPVLLGSKWVSNKWIRYNGNIFNARCGLTEDSLYDL